MCALIHVPYHTDTFFLSVVVVVVVVFALTAARRSPSCVPNVMLRSETKK